MPVTGITTDVDTRTLTITAEFAAPVTRVWAMYADPRQLEQVWGPPEYPATFVDHDLRPGTRTTYYMTSPEGEKFAGYWDITDVVEHQPRVIRRGDRQRRLGRRGLRRACPCRRSERSRRT